MKHNQIFQVKHDRERKLKPSEIVYALSRCYPGVLKEKEMTVKEIPMGPHTLGSLNHK